MSFELVKYYDTNCDKCGNWASHDFHPSDIGSTKKAAEKFLKNMGWKRINGETWCAYCIQGKIRFSQ
ncbi:hypothetical protein [Paenibacillus oleatilyticus]|uniref:hypothetical protein n=1 Tax=Paenibacillus oleatilyticus TaxID=2594886 RepID=UPI001C1FD338|nr:hypothetical protein [Paenibacillus oleatilyticus]MBU7316038.1 hypothetical protein [Paenibacillus oleatilyticus]